MMRLDGKSALITGAARGIGLEFARAYAAEGARVAICDINAQAAADAAAALGDAAIAVRLDVTDQKSIDTCVAEVEEAFGGIDILVNNAGTLSDAPIDTFSEQDWDGVLDLNLKSPFFLLQKLHL